MRVQRLVDPRPQLRRVGAHVVQQREHDPLGVAEQREQHVLGLDELMVAGDGLLLGLLQAPACDFDRELVQVHRAFTSWKSSRVMRVHRVVARAVADVGMKRSHRRPRSRSPAVRRPRRIAGVVDVGGELHPMGALVVEQVPTASTASPRRPVPPRDRRPRRARSRARTRPAAAHPEVDAPGPRPRAARRPRSPVERHRIGPSSGRVDASRRSSSRSRDPQWANRRRVGHASTDRQQVVELIGAERPERDAVAREPGHWGAPPATGAAGPCAAARSRRRAGPACAIARRCASCSRSSSTCGGARPSRARSSMIRFTPARLTPSSVSAWIASSRSMSASE